MYVILADRDNLLDFLTDLVELELNKDGKYVVLTIEEEPYNKEDQIGYIKACKYYITYYRGTSYIKLLLQNHLTNAQLGDDTCNTKTSIALLSH